MCFFEIVNEGGNCVSITVRVCVYENIYLWLRSKIANC